MFSSGIDPLTLQPYGGQPCTPRWGTPIGVVSPLFYGGHIRPDRPDRKLFDHLAAKNGPALVSLYLPTHVRGAEINQDRIRLKNRMSETDEILEAAGWSPQDRSTHLDPVQTLLEDEEFWRHQGKGLAVFLGEEGEPAVVSLDHEPEERTVVAPVFHLRPLVPSLQAIELWTLVLTRGAVRLYLVSRSEARRAEVDLPESFEDVNWFVDREKQRQRHPDRAGTNRARHGHEGGYGDEDLRRFMRAVAEALPDSGPKRLVVLGDDNLASRFAAISDRETLSPDNGGVADVDDPVEIREKTAPIIEHQGESEIESIIEQARESLGTGAAITDMTQGLEAAVGGRIASLVIDRDAEPLWGEFDPESLEITVHDKRGSFDVDLLDRLVVHAMSTGAEVSVSRGPVDGHPFVATTRF